MSPATLQPAIGGVAPPPPPIAPPAAGEPPRRKWTRPEFLRLDELGFFDDHRVQLVFGEIIEMGNMGWPHARAMILVGARLRAVFAEGHWVAEEKPFAAADSLPVPDFAVYEGSVLDQSDHPDRAALVIEVADSTLQYDTTTKAELYATAGVTDYWVIDLNGRRLLIYRDPEPLPAGLGATAYRTHSAHGPDATVSPLAAPHVAVTVADLLP